MSRTSRGTWTSRRADDTLPGIVYRGQYNDANQRGFYHRWLDMMTADDVRQLPARPAPKLNGVAETRDLPGLYAL